MGERTHTGQSIPSLVGKDVSSPNFGKDVVGFLSRNWSLAFDLSNQCSNL